MKASMRKRGSMKEKAKAVRGAMDAKGESEVKPTMVLKVKGGMKYRGARDQWYQVLQACDGKSPDEFIKLTKDKPPSLTKKGEAENPQGWLRFFLRTGAVSLGA